MSTIISTPPDVVGSVSEWECLAKEAGNPFAITFMTGARRAVLPYHELKNVIGTDTCLTLEFHSRKVEIDGEGLLVLAELIGDHRVRRVKRVDRILSVEVLEYRAKEDEDDA
jgi:hypothetical protein